MMQQDDDDVGMDIPDEELTEDTDIAFFSASGDEILRLCDSGDIYVHGNLADSDKAVVDALREFLKNTGHIG